MNCKCIFNSNTNLINNNKLNNMNNKSNNVCGICLDNCNTSNSSNSSNTSNTNNSTELSCSHIFHTNCIGKWTSLQINPECPMCRTLINQNELENLGYSLKTNTKTNTKTRTHTQTYSSNLGIFSYSSNTRTHTQTTKQMCSNDNFTHFYCKFIELYC